MILHIFKKDIRHSRLLLLVWLLLVAMQCLLIGSSARPGDLALQSLYFAISQIVPLFQILMLVVIIPLLVQEEPVVGTTAFWFTRPLSRSSVLGAKTLFVAMLVLLPLLAEIAMLAAHRVTLRDLGLAVPEIILSRLVVIVAVALVATLTPNLARFATVGAILMVASILLNLLIYMLPIWLNPDQVLVAAQNITRLNSRSIVGNLWMVVGGVAVIVHQYLTRKTIRSLVGAGVLATGAIAIMGFWSWNLFPEPTLPDFGTNGDKAAIKLSLRGTYLREVSTFRSSGVPQKSLDGTLVTLGLPEGYAASPKGIHPHLNSPEGGAIPVTKSYQGYYAAIPNIAAIEYALKGVPVVNQGFRGDPMIGLLKIDATAFNQFAGRPLKFTADVDLEISQYAIVTTMPLVRGSHYDKGSEHVVISEILRQGDGVEIVLHLSRVKLLFDAATQSVALGNISTVLGQQNDLYVLCNRKRNEAILTKRNSGISFSDMVVSSNASRLIKQTLRFSFGPEQYNLTPDLNEEWLANAELVRLHLTPVGKMTKELVIDKLRLDGTNASTVPQTALPVVNPASFAHLSLPENATRAQVKEYIHAILAASQRRTTYRNDDPQVGLLIKVGPANTDLLIEASEQALIGPSSMYLSQAINRLARPEDKQLVLKALAEHPQLIEVVTKYDWKAEAHDTLVAGLRDPQKTYLPREWIRVVASFEEPATYPDLKAYLARCSNKQETYNAIRKLRGIELRDVVDNAWSKVRYGRSYQILDACAMAAEFGHLDALDSLVSITQNEGNDSMRRRTLTLLKRFTPATGSLDEVIAWYKAHRDQLVYNPKRQRFVLNKSSSDAVVPTEGQSNPATPSQETSEEATKE